jgi:Flp pilus assembly protein TadG
MKIGNKVNKRRGERGTIIAIAAISAASMILSAGLAIDISHFYTAATELQNAADASALSGTSALNHTAAGITRAVDRAVASMNKYDLNGANITLARTDVRFAVNLSSFDNGGTGLSEASAAANPQNIRFVQVNVPASAVSTYFVSHIIGSALPITRSAVAGQSSTAVGVNKVCNPMAIVLYEDDVNNWDLNLVSPCPNTKQYTPGCVYNTYQFPEWCGEPYGGEYTQINEPTERCSSTDSWTKRIALGLDCITTCDTLDVQIDVPPSNVKDAINTRFDQYSGITASEAPPDANVYSGMTYSQYKANSPSAAPTHSAVPDRRVVIIPIARKSQYNSGAHTTQFYKYGAFFLRKKADNYGTIRLEYITDDVVVGDGSYSVSNGCTSATKVTVPVLYR